jgi:hypothetical protein
LDEIKCVIEYLKTGCAEKFISISIFLTLNSSFYHPIVYKYATIMNNNSIFVNKIEYLFQGFQHFQSISHIFAFITQGGIFPSRHNAHILGSSLIITEDKIPIRIARLLFKPMRFWYMAECLHQQLV